MPYPQNILTILLIFILVNVVSHILGLANFNGGTSNPCIATYLKVEIKNISIFTHLATICAMSAWTLDMCSKVHFQFLALSHRLPKVSIDLHGPGWDLWAHSKNMSLRKIEISDYVPLTLNEIVCHNKYSSYQTPPILSVILFEWSHWPTIFLEYWR